MNVEFYAVTDGGSHALFFLVLWRLLNGQIEMISKKLDPSAPLSQDMHGF